MARQRAYLDLHLAQPGGGLHGELARLARGVAPDVGEIRAALHKIDAREDCADFRLAGILRLLYQFLAHPLIPSELWAEIEAGVLGFKYWPDEPGLDDMCTWSENHHILFASGGYLAGQRYPERVFANAGHTGREQMARMRPAFYAGSTCAFAPDSASGSRTSTMSKTWPRCSTWSISAQDAEIAQRAAMVVDVMLLDLALNHFRGTLGCTHGRSYFRHKVDGRREDTASVFSVSLA